MKEEADNIDSSYYVFAYFDSARQEVFYIGHGHNGDSSTLLQKAIEGDRGSEKTLDPLGSNEVVYRIRSLMRFKLLPVISFLHTHLTKMEALRLVGKYRTFFGSRDNKTGCLLSKTTSEKNGIAQMKTLMLAPPKQSVGDENA